MNHHAATNLQPTVVARVYFGFVHVTGYSGAAQERKRPSGSTGANHREKSGLFLR